MNPVAQRHFRVAEAKLWTAALTNPDVLSLFYAWHSYREVCIGRAEQEAK